MTATRRCVGLGLGSRLGLGLVLVGSNPNPNPNPNPKPDPNPYDGHQALCTARGLRAAITRCNAVDLQRRSVTYESRLLKYAMRGFAIAVSPALLDRKMLDAASFDDGTLMFSTARSTGLRRLLVAEQFAIARRSTGPNGRGKPAAEGPPVKLREAWEGTSRMWGGVDKSKGFLPTLSIETTYHGSGERNLNLDEWFNLQASPNPYPNS